ncbi:MAG: c-type cytochrome [Mucilaginibacter sp.]|jgi:cytochrome c
MKKGLFYLGVFSTLMLCVLVNFAGSPAKKTQQENQPPVVKIVNPKNNSSFDWDTPISYSITVSDKEDGESKFNEINAKEVLLEVKYAGNKPAAMSKNIQPEEPGLALMRTSNCFNCHNFNSKSLGPSFNDVCKKYPVTKANIDTMVKRIKEGSSGHWEGREKMPSHPELTVNEIKSTVQWILKHAADPNESYYIGTEGVFRIKQTKLNQKGTYILTASYTDHGLKNVPGKRLVGRDVITIQSK